VSNSEETPEDKPALPKRRLKAIPVRGMRKPKTGKHAHQGKDRKSTKGIERDGEMVRVGALGWNKNWTKRIADFDDICNELNKLYKKAGTLEGITENLMKFEAEERVKPRHKSYESAQGVFMAYAITKMIPPRFVFDNYGINLNHFKAWVNA